MAISNELEEILRDFNDILGILPKSITKKDENLTEMIREKVIHLTLDKIGNTLTVEWNHDEIIICSKCESKEVKIKLPCEHNYCENCFNLEHDSLCPLCNNSISNKLYEF